MFVLPTTKDGMNAAIGHFIWDHVAEKIREDAEKDAARRAAPGFVEEKFVWKKEDAPKPAFDLAVFCASVRAGVGSKRGVRV